MPESASATPVPGFPEAAAPASSLRGWYVVLLLALLFAVSLVDRFIPALLAEPIARDLGLSDTQLGLLVGTGFAILYSIAGVPLAHLIDRYDRRKIVAAGVMLWSVTTIMSAFARSFEALLALRAGVAIGEAVLTPAAVSLIADLFPRERRALPMSLYLSIGAVMGIGSFVVGGGALQLATHYADDVAMAPWRLTLLIIGVPGVALSLLLRMTVAEPARTGSSSPGVDVADLATFIAYFRHNAGFYVPFLLGGGLYCLFGLSLVTWLPTILVRSYGYQPAEAGYAYGLLGVPAGLVGMFLWPRFASRIERRRPLQGAPIGLLLASIVGIPIFAATTALHDAHLMFVGVVCATMLASAWSILPPLCFQTFGPSRMRARLMALNLLALNLIGFGFGPLLTVWFSAFWPDDPRALGYGLAALGGLAAVGAAFCYALCLRAIGRLKPGRA